MNIPIHLPVSVTRVEERYEMLGSLAPIHVEGEQTAVIAADVATEDLQLSFILVPGRAVTTYECLDVGQERYDAVRIKVVGIRRFGA